MRGDGRSRRVMVVPDAFLNPAAGDDALLGLAEAGWGVVALPRAGLPAHVREAALAAVVDQLTAFLDDGYEVALADPRDPMAAALDDLLRDQENLNQHACHSAAMERSTPAKVVSGRLDRGSGATTRRSDAKAQQGA